MSCGGVSEAGKSPWNTRGVIALASLAVITLLVGSILAILVQTQIATLPSALKVTNLLIGGIAAAVIFSILSLVTRYCCCREQKKQVPDDPTKTTTGNTPLDPSGKGKVGAAGAGSKSNSEVKTGVRKDLLG